MRVSVQTVVCMTLVNTCETHSGSHAHAYGHTRGCAQHTQGGPQSRLSEAGLAQDAPGAGTRRGAAVCRAGAARCRLGREEGAPLASFAAPSVQGSGWGAARSPPPSRKGDEPPTSPPLTPLVVRPRLLPRPAPTARSLPPSLLRPLLPPRLAPRSLRSLPEPRQSAEPGREPEREPERALGDSASGGGGSRPWSVRSPHPRRSGPSPHAGLRAACAAAACRPQPWPRPRCGARAASTPAPAAEAAAAAAVAAPGRLGAQN